MVIKWALMPHTNLNCAGIAQLSFCIHISPSYFSISCGLRIIVNYKMEETPPQDLVHLTWNTPIQISVLSEDR